jgi:uncharacterized protein (TIGR03437 family)
MVPYEASGTVAVSVWTGNNSSYNYGNITVVSSAPRIFISGAQNSTGGGQGAILNAVKNNVLVDSNNPASVGDILSIYCEGLGQVSPAAVTGIAGGGQITGALTVTIGGINAPLDYKGVAPGFVGLYQVNAHIPAGVTSGNAVQVQLTDAAGNKSNIATIAVK